MKLLSLLAVGLVAAHLEAPTTGRIIVKRSSSDKEVATAEARSLKELGFQSDITVIERNAKGEITKLNCTVYSQSGGKGTCGSEDFGALEIKPGATCRIADRGREKHILSKK